MILNLIYLPQFAEGYKVPPEKTQSHLESQFPPEMTLPEFQQNFQTLK